ncbi:MAG: phosphotransferase [Gammaproteobacteria bacterium]|nr:phosphotransferase [Gammaproteobacteria bacterium]
MNSARLPPEIPGLGRLGYIRRLSGGGGWNETWLAARGEERFAVRFDTSAVRLLGLDRNAELGALQAIQGRGLGPDLVYADLPGGLLVTRWLPGRACAPASLRNPRLLRHLGKTLRRLHETVPSPPNVAPLDLARSVRHYAAIVGGVRARTMARAACRSLNAAAGHRRNPALCHNDPAAQNFLRGPALRLIDWEFAAPGDPLFDLAVVIRHHDLDEGQGRALLGAARGRVHRSDWRGLTHLVDGYGNVRLLWEAAVRAVAQID